MKPHPLSRSTEPHLRAAAPPALIPALLLTLLLAALPVRPAYAAGSAPSPAARCSVSVQDVLFGTYDPSSAGPANTIGQFSVMCTGSAALTISIGPSRTSGSGADRRMRHRSRSDTLAYNLFMDSSFTRVWGDGAVGSPLAANVTGRYVGQIFGQIFARQDAWVGDYEDTVTITVLP